MPFIERLTGVRREEAGALTWALAYGFCIFLAYYILRPVRDEISAADRGNVHLLWTVVFLVMLVAVPLYSSLVARVPRGIFIPRVNRFFILNLVLFFAVVKLLPTGARPWIDRVFYIWASVFALFVATVFWGYMADLFTNEQGRRLYGPIAMGGSLGAIAGSAAATLLVGFMHPFGLLLVACVPLEVASQAAGALHRGSARPGAALRFEDAPVAGGIWTGIRVALRSPYLRRIALYIILMTFASTVLYFQQAELIGEAYSDRALRTALFAKMDLAVNVITIFTQAFLTAHIVRWVGIGLTLAAVPLLSVAGFLGLGLYPSLGILITVQVLYRSMRYALAKPSREVLFTVVSRDEKYQAKAFIDAAIYRGGDLASAWVYAGLAAVGLTVGGIALVAVPAAAVWLLTGLDLGRRQDRLAAEQATGMAPADPKPLASTD